MNTIVTISQISQQTVSWTIHRCTMNASVIVSSVEVGRWLRGIQSTIVHLIVTKATIILIS